MRKKHRANWSKQFALNLIKIKNPDEMLEEAKVEGLEKTLSVFDIPAFWILHKGGERSLYCAY